MKSLGPCHPSKLAALQRPARPGRVRSVDRLSIPTIEHAISSSLTADIVPREVDVVNTKHGSLGVRRCHRGLVARLFVVTTWWLLTSPTAFASNLILDPGEGGTLIPKPYMGGHGFRFDFEEQTGKFTVEDLHSSGAILSRATLDFDGTILGDPSWIIEIGTTSGLINVNEAFGDLVLPPGVGRNGTVDSLHGHQPGGGGWGWDNIQLIFTDSGDWWLFVGDVGYHGSLPSPFPTDPPAIVSFTNQTGGRVDIHSLVPEPSTQIVLFLASAVVLSRRRESTTHRFRNGMAPVVLDLTTEVQRSISPPAVARNAKLQRVVQPTAVSAMRNCSRCVSTQQETRSRARRVKQSKLWSKTRCGPTAWNRDCAGQGCRSSRSVDVKKLPY